MALNNLLIGSAHNGARIWLHGDMDVTLGVGLPSSFSVLFFTTTEELFAIKSAESITGIDGKSTQSLPFGGMTGLSIELSYDNTAKRWLVVDNNIMRDTGIPEHLVSEYEWEKDVVSSINISAAPGTRTTAGDIVVTATTVSLQPVDYVEFYRNDVKVGTDRTAPYTFTDPVTLSHNGTITYHAKLYDTHNNVVSSGPVSVVVDIPLPPPPPPADATPPTVTLVADTTSFSVLLLTATAADNVGVTKVEFVRNGVVVSTRTGAPYTATQNITDADNGTVTFTARAYDAATNSTTSSAVAVTVQIAKPTEVTQLTIDTMITASVEEAIAEATTGTDSTGKRLAAAQAIIDEMAPSHTLNIYRDGVTIFTVGFAGPMVIYNDGKDIGVGLNDVISGAALKAADINTGKWAFQIVGGSRGQRLIAGTVGAPGSNADIILQESPFQGQQFDAIVNFILDRSVDGLS
jgi:hypothetical protein